MGKVETDPQATERGLEESKEANRSQPEITQNTWHLSEPAGAERERPREAKAMCEVWEEEGQGERVSSIKAERM